MRYRQLKRRDKFTNKCFIQFLICSKHKLHTVTSTNVEYFGNIKLRPYTFQTTVKRLITNYKFPQVLKVNVLMSKGNYF